MLSLSLHVCTGPGLNQSGPWKSSFHFSSKAGVDSSIRLRIIMIVSSALTLVLAVNNDIDELVATTKCGLSIRMKCFY